MSTANLSRKQIRANAVNKSLKAMNEVNAKKNDIRLGIVMQNGISKPTQTVSKVSLDSEKQNAGVSKRIPHRPPAIDNPLSALEKLATLAKSESWMANAKNIVPIGNDALKHLAQAAQRGESFSMQSTLPNYDALRALADAARRGERVLI